MNKHNQHGASLVFVTLLLAVLLGFFALAIDVGYLFVVRNELQNAADAAALAGAGASGVYLSSGEPDWINGRAQANVVISLNKAANKQLINRDIVSECRNLSGVILPGGGPCSSTYFPAFQVTIRKTAGQNDGGVSTFFAGVLGIKSLDVGAMAIAVASGFPGDSHHPKLVQ